VQRLDRLKISSKVCSDPACPWAGLPAPLHFAKHNQPCAELFIGRDGSEMLCELPGGHEGAHRGSVHRD
jgi:hypothetical protein